jgi:hypothetical protein
MDVEHEIDAVEQRAAEAPPVLGVLRVGAAAPGSPAKPHGHGFVAATSMKRVG